MSASREVTDEVRESMSENVIGRGRVTPSFATLRESSFEMDLDAFENRFETSALLRYCTQHFFFSSRSYSRLVSNLYRELL